MEWLNLPGLTVILALLAPNILFAARRPNTQNACHQRGLIIGEQIGRYGCMALMCLHTGLWEFGYAAPGWAGWASQARLSRGAGERGGPPEPVPEPLTMLLAGTVLAALGLLGRRVRL